MIRISFLPIPLAFVWLFMCMFELEVLWGRAVFFLNINKEGQKEDDKEEGVSFRSAIHRN